MAACEDCGGKAGLLSKVCASCLNKRIEKANQQRSAENAKAEAERQEIISQEYKRILNDVKNGSPCFLYSSHYVPVDGEIGGGSFQAAIYDDSNVKLAGLEGWKVVGVIPHTFGELLSNKEGYSTIWAGGTGGNVIGVYVLMEMSLNQSNIDRLSDDVLEHLQQTVQ